MNKIQLFFVLTGIFLLSCVSTRETKAPPFAENLQPPTLLEAGELIYPWQAWEEGLEGWVNLYFLVSDKGEVMQVRITKSSGYKILDDAIIKYIKRLKFSPARRKGDPTTICITWSVNYNLVAKTPLFEPEKYVQKIKHMMNLTDQCSRKERTHILEKILHSHEQYVQSLKQMPYPNHNIYIKKFVKLDVFE